MNSYPKAYMYVYLNEVCLSSTDYFSEIWLTLSLSDGSGPNSYKDKVKSELLEALFVNVIWLDLNGPPYEGNIFYFITTDLQIL